ncbi:MAG TPA: SurA N-terminal domain-containing protein [Aestuariivirgaceae bacterium]|jgi:peptidyl-prolyl cis-trans isomerase D
MMDSLRGAATGWVAKILIGLLALSFAIWGINDVFTGYRSDVLASVGDYEITADEFRMTFEQRLRNLSRQTGQSITNQRATEMGLDRQILADMLRNAALQQQARNMRLAVPDSLVAEEIAGNPAFQNSRGQFDANRFRQILQQSGLSEQMLLGEERAGKLRQAIADPLLNEIQPPETLVEAAVRHLNERRDAKYFVLKANEAEIPPPSEVEIKSYYEKNPQAFTAPAYRSVVLLKIEPQDLVSSINVAEEDIAAAYETDVDSYRTPERRTIQQLTFPTIEDASAAKQRIDQGTDFLVIAKEKGLSENDITLGHLAHKDIPDKAIADAAFVLTPNTVSPPVEGRLAKVLLRVTKVTPEVVKPFAEVRNEIANKLKFEHAREEILNMHGRVEDERAGGANFEAIAKGLNLPHITVPAVDARGLDKSGKPVQIPAKSEVLALAFESDVGVETDPVAMKNDGFVWVDVRDVTPAALRPFAEVRAEAQKAYIAQKLREQVLKKANEMVKRAEAGTTLETLAREAGAEVRIETGLKRNEARPTFDSTAVSVLFLAADNGYVYAPEQDGKGAKIIQALPIVSPPYDSKSKEAESVRKALAEGLSNDILATYVSGVQKSFGISVNDQLWRQTTGVNQ